MCSQWRSKLPEENVDEDYKEYSSKNEKERILFVTSLVKKYHCCRRTVQNYLEAGRKRAGDEQTSLKIGPPSPQRAKMRQPTSESPSKQKPNVSFEIILPLPPPPSSPLQPQGSSQASSSSSSSSSSSLLPSSVARANDDMHHYLAKHGIAQLQDALFDYGYTSPEHMDELKKFPDPTKDHVLQEWKDGKKMTFKDWAKLHAMMYSSSF
ncbi:hypothetical protein QCA50_001890 [Cerrena zonata]|uniref:Uncharacterized protein n=1 Tax=Cerrena zonata TaxID=2478898 RepID=A0AAW0GPX3_9APHY